jgi:RNA polymerase sigma-70 factor (ECF subfamily)
MNFLEDPDALLMAEVAAGNLDAFENLVIRHQNSAWSLAYRFLGNAPDAEDVVQEAFLRILRAASGYRPAAQFRTYLFSIIGNLCKDRLSKKRALFREETALLRDPKPDAGELLDNREREAAVRSALDSLPARQRAAVLLRHYEGLSYDEIAVALRVSSKAVDSLLDRARHTLQRRLSALK